MATRAGKGKRGALHASIGRMKIDSLDRALLPVSLLAVGCFVLAALGFGAALDGYSQHLYPLSALGAIGTPRAWWASALVFVVPGLLGTWVAALFHLRLPEAGGALARIGAWILLFSTVAFALQGLFRLDYDDLQAATGRLHVLSWALWWMTTAAGGLLLALGLRRCHGRRATAAVALATAILVPLLAMAAPTAWSVEILRRVGFVCWFGWWVFAAFAISRSAASVPGSPRPG
jgi:hypothetical protein